MGGKWLYITPALRATRWASQVSILTLLLKHYEKVLDILHVIKDKNNGHSDATWNFNSGSCYIVTQFVLGYIHVYDLCRLHSRQLIVSWWMLISRLLIEHCFSLCLLVIVLPVLVSFGHCIACPFSIYGFWLTFWRLQTFLSVAVKSHIKLYRDHLAMSGSRTHLFWNINTCSI